jgi:hypothetical protein
MTFRSKPHIKNAYLTAPVTEKIWCVLGPKIGDNAGKRAIIVHSLYGLKSTGADPHSETIWRIACDT